LHNNDFIYILFHTIHDVLRAEKILKQHNLAHELIPVPRNLSSDCGMCVKLQNDIDKALLLCAKMDIAGCYNAEGKEFKEVKSI
jgi:hypothetical protein